MGSVAGRRDIDRRGGARGRVRRVPYDTPWLRYSRPLRDSDPKKGTFENCEYRTILRRDGRLHDFEYLEHRAILRQRAQQPENKAQKPSTALPGQTPILREYRAYSETAARLRGISSPRSPVMCVCDVKSTQSLHLRSYTWLPERGGVPERRAPGENMTRLMSEAS